LGERSKNGHGRRLRLSGAKNDWRSDDQRWIVASLGFGSLRGFVLTFDARETKPEGAEIAPDTIGYVF